MTEVGAQFAAKLRQKHARRIICLTTWNPTPEHTCKCKFNAGHYQDKHRCNCGKTLRTGELKPRLSHRKAK